MFQSCVTEPSGPNSTDHMPPIVATFICTIGIIALVYLDRYGGPRISKAVWIPAIWLFLISSRPLSIWLGIGWNSGAVDATQAYVEGSPVDRAVFICLILAALVVLFARADKVGALLRKNVVIGLFFLFCAVSILWSDFPFVAFKRWTKAIGDLAMVLIILTESHPLVALKRVLSRLGFLLFPLSVLLIKYYPYIGRRFTNSWEAEPIGVTLQKNALGLDCLIFGVFFLWMFWSVYRERDNPSRRRRLVAYAAMIAVIIWLLIQCNSMTSIVGFVCAGGVMWLAMRPSRKPALVHVLVLAVLGMATTAVFLDPGGGMVQVLGKDPTLTGRKEIWNLVLRLHTNPWIGTGFETFWLGPRLASMRTALENFPINEAHNGYIEVYLNLGWAGIGFIAVMLMTAYKRVISGWRQNPRLGSLFLGFLLCTLFNAFTENAFRMMTPSWIFLLLVIMAGSQRVLFENAPRTGPAQAGDIAAAEEPVYATEGASPVTRLTSEWILK
jgi:exopolysaccharide production protein ExoQ